MGAADSDCFTAHGVRGTQTGMEEEKIPPSGEAVRSRNDKTKLTRQENREAVPGERP